MERYDQFESRAAEQILGWALDTFGDELAFVTSFQDEGMAILDMAVRISSGIRVITLDTGRLPEETHRMMETVRNRCGIRIETVFPDPAEVESMVAEHGPNLFRHAVPLRMLCCQVRKVRPLARKMMEFRAAVMGLRRGQSETRAGIPKVEDRDGLVRICPLADWTRAEVAEYLLRRHVPRHPLYALGYTSIGCAPCTRAALAGQNGRGGRWWWERDAAKECGLHFTADGRAERQVDVLIRDLVSKVANGAPRQAPAGC